MPTAHHSFPTPEPITLDLQVDRGTVDVVASDAAETTADISSRDADVYRVELDGGRLRIEPVRRFLHSPRVHVTVHLPTGSRLEIATASASVEVRGVIAEAKVSSASGSITVDEVVGSVELGTASGSARVRTAGGDVTFQSASGSLKVERVGGGCTARTASGSITIGRADGDIDAKSVSGAVRVGEAHTGTVELRSTSGSVGVGVRRGTLVWLDVASVSGRVVSELTGEAAPGVGESSLDLHAHSVSGSIQIGSVGPSA